MFVHGTERWWIISCRTYADSKSLSFFSLLYFMVSTFGLFFLSVSFQIHTQSISLFIRFILYYFSSFSIIAFSFSLHCITAFSGGLEWGSFSLLKWMATLCSNGHDCSVGDNTTISCQNWITLWLEHLVVVFFSLLCVLAFYDYMPFLCLPNFDATFHLDFWMGRPAVTCQVFFFNHFFHFCTTSGTKQNCKM